MISNRETCIDAAIELSRVEDRNVSVYPEDCVWAIDYAVTRNLLGGIGTDASVLPDEGGYARTMVWSWDKDDAENNLWSVTIHEVKS